jgi:uncharacterized protein YfaP (DUF2135 family)
MKKMLSMAWDDPQAEMDLHVITPDGGHAFRDDPVLANVGGMDLDSVDGAGPEMFSLTASLAGAYHVVVNYWGNFGPAVYHFDEKTRQRHVVTARITLVFAENQPAERVLSRLVRATAASSAMTRCSAFSTACPKSRSARRR